MKAAMILVLAIGIPLAWIASRQMTGKSRIKG
jgi:ABC-type sulfate transport system permease component